MGILDRAARRPVLIRRLLAGMGGIGALEGFLLSSGDWSQRGFIAAATLAGIPIGFLLVYIFAGSWKAWLGRTFASLVYALLFAVGLVAALLAMATVLSKGADEEFAAAIGGGIGFTLGAFHVWRRDCRDDVSEQAVDEPGHASGTHGG